MVINPSTNYEDYSYQPIRNVSANENIEFVNVVENDSK